MTKLINKNYLYEKDLLLKRDKQDILERLEEANAKQDTYTKKFKQYHDLQAEFDKNRKVLVAEEMRIRNNLREIRIQFDLFIRKKKEKYSKQNQILSQQLSQQYQQWQQQQQQCLQQQHFQLQQIYENQTQEQQRRLNFNKQLYDNNRIAFKKELEVVTNKLQKSKEQEKLAKEKLEFYSKKMNKNKEYRYELKESLSKLDSERITKAIPDFMDWE